MFQHEIESHGTSGRIGCHSFDDGPRLSGKLVHFRMEDSGQQLFQMSRLGAAAHGPQHLHLVAGGRLVDGFPRVFPLQLIAVSYGRAPDCFQLLRRDPVTTEFSFNRPFVPKNEFHQPDGIDHLRLEQFRMDRIGRQNALNRILSNSIDIFIQTPDAIDFGNGGY